MSFIKIKNALFGIKTNTNFVFTQNLLKILNKKKTLLKTNLNICTNNLVEK